MIANAIDIQNPQIDERALFEAIEKGLKARRSTAKAQGLNFDALNQRKDWFGAPEDGDLDEILYLLEMTERSNEELGLEVTLMEQSSSPFSSLLNRARTILHQVAVYYVNLFAVRQAHINNNHGEAIRTLLVELQRSQQQIRTLEAEVAQLRKRAS